MPISRLIKGDAMDLGHFMRHKFQLGLNDMFMEFILNKIRMSGKLYLSARTFVGERMLALTDADLS